MEVLFGHCDRRCTSVCSRRQNSLDKGNHFEEAQLAITVAFSARIPLRDFK